MNSVVKYDNYNFTNKYPNYQKNIANSKLPEQYKVMLYETMIAEVANYDNVEAFSVYTKRLCDWLNYDFQEVLLYTLRALGMRKNKPTREELKAAYDAETEFLDSQIFYTKYPFKTYITPETNRGVLLRKLKQQEELLFSYDEDALELLLIKLCDMLEIDYNIVKPIYFPPFSDEDIV